MRATRVNVQVPLDTVVSPPKPLMILLACLEGESPIISIASLETMDMIAPQSYSTFSLKHCPSFSAATICRHLSTTMATPMRSHEVHLKEETKLNNFLLTVF